MVDERLCLQQKVNSRSVSCWLPYANYVSGITVLMTASDGAISTNDTGTNLLKGSNLILFSGSVNVVQAYTQLAKQPRTTNTY